MDNRVRYTTYHPADVSKYQIETFPATQDNLQLPTRKPKYV
jgi:hypothetical protein